MNWARVTHKKTLSDFTGKIEGRSGHRTTCHFSVFGETFLVHLKKNFKEHCPFKITKFHLPSWIKNAKHTNMWNKTKAVVWRQSAGLQGLKWITVHQI